MPEAPKAPVSWGELIDKITILEIKSVAIAQEAARTNVEHELRLLREIAAVHATDEEIATLARELKAINLALWKTEDAIREKERNKEFDQSFIDLARSVYQQNDERARIKRKINNVLASELVEEKSYRDY